MGADVEKQRRASKPTKIRENQELAFPIQRICSQKWFLDRNGDARLSRDSQPSMHINVTNKKSRSEVNRGTNNEINLANGAPPQRSGSTLTTIQVLNRPQLQSVEIQVPDGTQKALHYRRAS